MHYAPNPINTSKISLSDELIRLTELLAANIHDTWAKARLSEGWVYGKKKDSDLRTTPCLVPYDALPEEEKAYDRATAMETIKVLVYLGYSIEKPSPGRGTGRKVILPAAPAAF